MGKERVKDRDKSIKVKKVSDRDRRDGDIDQETDRESDREV